MNSSNSVYLCPAGYDCGFANSCPVTTAGPSIACPKGWFCGTYASFSGDDLVRLDVQAARWLLRGPDVRITPENAARFAPAGRVVQQPCFRGFYCPNATTLIKCPAGSFCPELTITPLRCDALSMCGAPGNAFQINFAMILIAAVLVTMACISSSWLRRRQAAKDSATRAAYAAALASASTPTAPTSIGVVEKPRGAAESPVAARTSVGLRVRDLTVVIGGTSILQDVSATIRPGALNAIMGPSGCGKSTLVNALLGDDGVRVVRGSVDLTTNAAGGGSSSPVVRPRMCHVPQVDIIDRAPSVRELVTFNARTRCASSLTDAQVRAKVDRTLALLGIAGVADSIIGGTVTTAANISGGQLKRVSIACELVTLEERESAVLLLDEPTAGLDASVAQDLVSSLRAVTEAGTTVVLVIQQPRAEIFDMIHHLILLQRGRVVYEGDAGAAAAYFRELGFSPSREVVRSVSGRTGGDVPEHALANADFIIDVLCGGVEFTPTDAESALGGFPRAPPGPVMPSVQASPERTDSAEEAQAALLAAQWRTRNHAASIGNKTVWHNDDSLVSSDGSFSGDNPMRGNARRTSDSSSSVSSSSSPAWSLPQATTSLHTHEQGARSLSLSAAVRLFGVEVALHAQRAVLARLRNFQSLAVYIFLHGAMAVVLSAGFSVMIQMSYLNTFNPPMPAALARFCPAVAGERCLRNAQDLGGQQLLFFMTIALGQASALSSVPLFGGSLPVLARESAAGGSVLALSIGKMAGDALFIGVNASMYAGVWMLFAHSGRWYAWWALVLATAFAASSVGYVTSVLTRPMNASVIAVFAITAFAVFSGTEPQLASVARFPVISWPWMLSFATWTAEGTYAVWTSYLYGTGVTDVQGGADFYGFQVSSYDRALGALVGIGLMWRAVTVIVLLVRFGRLRDAWRALASRGASRRPLSAPNAPRTTAVAALAVSK